MRKLNKFSYNNEDHVSWLDDYLRKVDRLPLVQEHYFILVLSGDNKTIKEKFENLVEALHNSAEGREIWRRLNNAWLKKLRRDNARTNGTKFYSFELSTEFEKNLKKLKKLTGNSTYRDILESLVNNTLIEFQNNQDLNQETKPISSPNINNLEQFAASLEKLAPEETGELQSKAEMQKISTDHLRF
ncbi:MULTISPECIES: hypothetical protein [unclassified Vibrio]|uniref:hypothetical protein n=1 Tax=unclassified Vibrio TaxID=2614977 RepID=UPI001A8CC9AE|nr:MULTISPECIES: hypothetical protein [unclassified Vibrio]MBO0244969.1 hypothetical protein [Vibrio sp. Vb0592]MDW1735459.1 hypothetical protein [Vibrio sp. Vb2235]MDW1787731.1 hypothetical protein [Vibrio sp. Vb2227]MDW1817324.1 hypothetical protein [Vibrio sp. Vb2232]MDW1866905.1 hypothetical protein [Vibrio sp. Vb1127]